MYTASGMSRIRAYFDPVTGSDYKRSQVSLGDRTRGSRSCPCHTADVSTFNKSLK
jgi:hypothetical protein